MLVRTQAFNDFSLHFADTTMYTTGTQKFRT